MGTEQVHCRSGYKWKDGVNNSFYYLLRKQCCFVGSRKRGETRIKNLRRRHSKRFMHERNARRTDSGKGLSAFKKPRCSRRRSKNIKLTKPVLLKIIFKKGEKSR